jgi:hypothetical protein
MLIELAIAAAFTFQYADKSLVSPDGSHTVVLSEHPEYFTSEDGATKNYMVHAINDGNPGSNFYLSLNDKECKAGTGSVAIAQNLGNGRIRLLGFAEWDSSKKESPMTEIGQAVCEVAANVPLVEFVDGTQKPSSQTVPNYTDPLHPAKHQYEYPL